VLSNSSVGSLNDILSLAAIITDALIILASEVGVILTCLLPVEDITVSSLTSDVVALSSKDSNLIFTVLSDPLSVTAVTAILKYSVLPSKEDICPYEE